MTDRELLRLAAIACGELSGEWRNNEAYFDGVLSRWNPLQDDGAALRLAVKLKLLIHVTDYSAFARHADEAWLGCAARRHGGIEAATRRVIVRAAAAIGRAMP